MRLRALFLALMPTVAMASPYADGISPTELTDLVSQAMVAAGQNGQIQVSQMRGFPACGDTPAVSPRSGDWRTVELRCSGPKSWSRSVRTSASAGTMPKRATRNEPAGIPVLTLTESLSAGTVIEPTHLTLKPVRDGSLDGLMTDAQSVIGRTLTVNLGEGRPVLARHLEHDWLVTEGTPVGNYLRCRRNVDPCIRNCGRERPTWPDNCSKKCRKRQAGQGHRNRTKQSTRRG